jgi:hypothetical protein
VSSKHRNLSLGARSRTAWIVAAALASMLSVAGVLVQPVMGLGRAEAEREQAQKNAEACRAEQAMLRPYEAANGWERTAEALRSLSAKLPKASSSIEIHGALRLLANVHRIDLGSSSISVAKPTSFAVLDDCVVMREVDLRGSGSIADWVGFTEDLERSGYPTSVLELSLLRPSAQASTFEVHLVLGIYSSQPATASKGGGP